MLLVEFFIAFALIALLIALCFYIFRRVPRSISDDIDVPFISTPHEHLPVVADALAIKPGDVVYDLGCGDGRLLFYCAEKFPDTKFVGIERRPELVAQMEAKKDSLGLNNIFIRHANIFQADFSDATKIYAFLLPVPMELLAPRLPRARVVSRAFVLPGKVPVETITLPLRDDRWDLQTLYVYE